MTSHNRFTWYELYTTDPVSAQIFYGAVVGWTTKLMDGMGDYTLWVAPDGGNVGGVMHLPEKAKQMGAPPHWMGYVSVGNLGDTLAKAESLGARVFVPPQDLPGGARFAILGDPQGGQFGLHQAGAGQPDSEPQTRGVGHFSWAELMSPDPAASLAFYSAIFGWQVTSTMEMGEMGTYTMFGVDKDKTLGGMMGVPPGMKRAAWLYYTNVADADAAVTRIDNAGGKVMNGPMDVPGNGRILQANDAQGVWFALYADKT